MLGSDGAERTVDGIVDEMLDDVIRDGAVGLQAYCEKYPTYADEIRRVFPSLEALAKLNGDVSSAINDEVASRAAQIPPRLGEFQIVRQIGRGGMGVVFEAEQITLQRRVALKVLPLIAFLSAKQLQRFKNEARAAALLQHPNIVRIHSVGHDGAIHFYTMELIDGYDLAEVIRKLHSNKSDDDKEASGNRKDASTVPAARLSTLQSDNRREFYRSIAKVGIQCAEALHYAHEEGVIHRDIKPANLMLDQNGDIHITDFGLASVQAHEDITQTGDMVGTLRYMSPEQIASELPVDHRTDIYSLGLTLYELAGGHAAFASESRGRLLREIMEKNPVPLKKSLPDMPRDLETIIDKAISKDSVDRYVTAEEFAHDLQAFLDVRPIVARRSSQWDVFRRFARRNPLLAASIASAFLLVAMIAVGASVWASNSAELSRLQRKRLYASDMREARRLADDRKLVELQESLLRWHPKAGETDLRGFEWYHLWQYCSDPAVVRTIDRELPAMHLAFLGDDRIASLGFSPHATVFDINEKDKGEPEFAVQSPGYNLDGARYDAKHQLLAFGDDAGNVTLYDVQNSQILKRLQSNAGSGEQRSVETIDFSLDTTQVLASGGTWRRGYVRLWDRHDSELLMSIDLTGHGSAVFGPHDSVVVSSYDRGELKIYHSKDRENPETVDLGVRRVLRIVSNADRSLVAVAAHVGEDDFRQWHMQVRDASNWQLVWRCQLPVKPESMHFLSQVDRLAWGDAEGNAWLARIVPDKKKGVVELRTKLHSSEIAGIAISPSGKRLGTAGRDGFTTIWDIEQLKAGDRATTDYDGEDFWATGICFAQPNSDEAIIAIRGDGIYRWDTVLNTRTQLPFDCSDAHNMTIAVADSGKICVSMNDWPPPREETTGRIQLLSEERGLQELVVPSVGISMTGLSMFPDGKYAFACSHHAGVLVFSTEGEFKLVKSIDLSAKTLRCCKDNRTVVVGDRNGFAHVLTAPNFEPRESVRLDARLVDSIDITADAQHIAAVGFDHKLRIYDRSKRRVRESVDKAGGFLTLARFSPDGKRVMTNSLDGVLGLWNAETCDLVQEHRTTVRSFSVGEFSADGSRFISAGVGFARVFHARNVEELKGLPAAELRSQACQDVIVNPFK